jgi:chromosome segregation ATPase
MSRKPKKRRMPEPKVEAWARSASDKPPIDQLTALREELQRMRIERAGHLSHIEELRAEIERLKAESETLRGAVAALPLPPGTAIYLAQEQRRI